MNDITIIIIGLVAGALMIIFRKKVSEWNIKEGAKKGSVTQAYYEGKNPEDIEWLVVLAGVGFMIIPIIAYFI